jgi:acyl carrier protein
MNIFENIKTFIISQRGSYKKPFTRQTTLEKDLKITGDDAWEFFQAFSKEFKVDISQFEISNHFMPEGSLALMKLTLFGKDTGKPPITLGDLEKAVEKKVMF